MTQEVNGGNVELSERYAGKYLIGLTGNIAVGKSLVRAMLAELGAAAIDADSVAHEVILKGGAAYDDIVAGFGAGILGRDGEIMRSALGRIVFANRAQMEKLESITHPAIGRRIEDMIEAAGGGVAVIEAIKLLEGAWKDAVDAVWVVDAPRKMQLERLIGRRGMSPEEAMQRILAQNSQAEKLRWADVVIKNDGDIEATRAQVERHWLASGLA